MEIPGVIEAKEKPYQDDVIIDLFDSIDNRLDDLVGMRLLRHVGKPLTTLAPANVIRSVTGVPKPSEVVEELGDKIERQLEGMQGGRGLPKLPGLRELL